MADTMSGGCACGRVRFTAAIHDDEAYLCHCRMCQRATGSVSIAFKGVKQADVAWESEPDWFDSSPIAERPFCAKCGTSLGFRFREGSDKIDLTVAAFDDPAQFVPKWHFGAESIHRA
ncbi:MAG: GFA family protein [Sphingomicrobium sp.]